LEPTTTTSKPTIGPSASPSAAPTPLDPVVTQNVNTTIGVNVGNSTNTTNTTAIIPGERQLRALQLQEFPGCASDATIAALEATTEAIVKPTLPSDKELKNVDTVACAREGLLLLVTQVLEIDVTCEESCAATAAQLIESNELADIIGDTINDSIDGGNFTTKLQEEVASCGKDCGDLGDATVDQQVEVVAGDVSIKTLTPSVSPSFRPTGSVSYCIVRIVPMLISYAYLMSQTYVLIFLTPFS